LNNTEISFDDLKQRQSVRATFKLPQEVIDLLGLIARQLGIKQKSLLDQLIEDTSMLTRLAERSVLSLEYDAERRQKTFVLSRSSLRSLNDIARQQNISRDVLVEISIKRLIPLIETELEKHIVRKTILEEMNNYLKLGETLLEKTQQLLGKDDILYGMLEKQISLAEKNVLTVDSIVAKGKLMEDW